MLKLLALFGDVLANLIAKLGTTLAGVVIIGCGLIWILPYFGVPAYMAQGGFIVAIGLGLIAFGKRWAVSEAEKRIGNPALPNSSSVPEIQKEITKLTTTGQP